MNKHGWYQTDDFIKDDAYTLRKGIYKTSSLSIKDGDSDGNFFKNPKTYKYSFWQNKKVFVSLKYETKHNRF